MMMRFSSNSSNIDIFNGKKRDYEQTLLENGYKNQCQR